MEIIMLLGNTSSILIHIHIDISKRVYCKLKLTYNLMDT